MILLLIVVGQAEAEVGICARELGRQRGCYHIVLMVLIEVVVLLVRVRVERRHLVVLLMFHLMMLYRVYTGRHGRHVGNKWQMLWLVLLLLLMMIVFVVVVVVVCVSMQFILGAVCFFKLMF